MDQNSFRSLLSTSGSGSMPRTTAGSGSRGNPSVNAPTKSKQIDASKPVFKPRKVKKADEGKYRDRAAERREGGGNDYAHVESVLEDFERRNANNEDKTAVKEQRKYLGGDGSHSILVKGLDMALLEQNKARAAFDSIEDDETLEKAYIEASTIPKKRTRADILNELKQKRSQPGQANDEVGSENTAKSNDDAKALEEAKKQGKFKPIGFKPIGSSGGNKKLKSGDGTDKHSKDGGEKKKKKRKVQTDLQTEGKTEAPSATEILTPARTTSGSKANTEPEPEPEPLGDDFNIFAGTGEYEGIDFGNDDEEEEGEVELKPPTEHEDALLGPAPTAGSKGWFVTKDDEIEVPSIPLGPTTQSSILHASDSRMRSVSPGHRPRDDGDDGQGRGLSDEEEQRQSVRLQPLSSSALPSIRDFLAVDEAAEAAEKRRKRKDKMKGGGGGSSGKSMEEKVNRDYQRLQSYTSKEKPSGSR